MLTAAPTVPTPTYAVDLEVAGVVEGSGLDDEALHAVVTEHHVEGARAIFEQDLLEAIAGGGNGIDADALGRRHRLHREARLNVAVFAEVDAERDGLGDTDGEDDVGLIGRGVHALILAEVAGRHTASADDAKKKNEGDGQWPTPSPS